MAPLADSTRIRNCIPIPSTCPLYHEIEISTPLNFKYLEFNAGGARVDNKNGVHVLAALMQLATAALVNGRVRRLRTRLKILLESIQVAEKPQVSTLLETGSFYVPMAKSRDSIRQISIRPWSDSQA
jgi:hypothetical protein